MKRWGDFEVIRHKVTLYGRVFHRNGQPCSGAFVSAQRTSKPKKRGKADAAIGNDVESARSNWQTTASRRDGLFFFLNLPEGDYIVRAEEHRSGERGQNYAKVTLNQRGEQQIPTADIELLLD